ncbi:ribosome-associated protein [Acetoanaerobium pronyense]|uniref:Ribosome-associated protein n=1 Tax=Acetoanaerobium pronyense TaxID=1482736 RepID=A0ABS4KLD0_9FIRM|nr:S4 domain-containing protein YaaA [Acetoanaerobium pronyense]MBP2028565.1 ribosome-associated protein [Acetoanaerobium pronyense]
MKEIKISTEYIKLDQFLKLVNEVGSGGEAKIMILDSKIKLNGVVEIQRGKKLRPGDVITIEDRSYKIV